MIMYTRCLDETGLDDMQGTKKILFLLFQVRMITRERKEIHFLKQELQRL